MRLIITIVGFFSALISVGHSVHLETQKVFGDGDCLQEISFKDLSLEPQCFPGSSPDFSELLNIPERVLSWGSNGLLGKPWHFKDNYCNQFYYELFHTIVDHNPNIKLSPHDLFHAHLGRYQHRAHRELFMVFHAKEYPIDLERVKNFYQIESERFRSSNKEYQARNFIYLSHTKKLFMVKEDGACEEYFSHESITTLSEQKISALLPEGKLIGDVNIFYKPTIQRIKYNFFSGYDEFIGEIKNDLEGYYSGKTILERQQSNTMFDAWLKTFTTTTLYFLTGLDQRQSS